jgi:FtsP/CotA-like multicopper oxidase with cupredoxin domain
VANHFRIQRSGETALPGVPEPGAHDRELSRRGFLRTGAGIGTALAVPGFLAASVENAGAETGGSAMGMDMPGQDGADTIGVRAVPFTEGGPLVEPELRRSVGGGLRTTLQVRYAYKDVGGYRLFMRTYEGTIPGPTLRLRRGDVLRIRLVNDLPPNRDPMPAIIDQPHHLNTRRTCIFTVRM